MNDSPENGTSLADADFVSSDTDSLGKEIMATPSEGTVETSPERLVSVANVRVP